VLWEVQHFPINLQNEKPGSQDKQASQSDLLNHSYDDKTWLHATWCSLNYLTEDQSPDQVTETKQPTDN
jgi:hypothetical protein